MILEESYTLSNGVEIPKLGLGTWFISNQDVVQAVKDAARDAAAGTDGDPVVLLSPACASFDQFADFEKRGEAFRAAVEEVEGFMPRVTAAS